MLATLKTELDSDGAPRDDLAPETLRWMQEMNLTYTKLSEVIAAGPDAKVMESLNEAVVRANKNSASNAQKIQKIAILPRDFSIPTGELGPTMKLKRNVVSEMYSDVIEKLYT